MDTLPAVVVLVEGGEDGHYLIQSQPKTQSLTGEQVTEFLTRVRDGKEPLLGYSYSKFAAQVRFI